MSKKFETYSDSLKRLKPVRASSPDEFALLVEIHKGKKVSAFSSELPGTAVREGTVIDQTLGVTRLESIAETKRKIILEKIQEKKVSKGQKHPLSDEEVFEITRIITAQDLLRKVAKKIRHTKVKTEGPLDRMDREQREHILFKAKKHNLQPANSLK